MRTFFVAGHRPPDGPHGGPYEDPRVIEPSQSETVP
jgi:hypothetical protein